MTNKSSFPIDKIIAGIGAAILLFSLMCIFQVSIMSADFISSLKSVWVIYMPILALIGGLYLLFGMKFQKIKKHKLKIHIFISIASWIWMILYINALNTPEFVQNDPLENYFFYGGIIAVILFMIIPQFLIGREIQKIENTKENI